MYNIGIGDLVFNKQLGVGIIFNILQNKYFCYSVFWMNSGRVSNYDPLVIIKYKNLLLDLAGRNIL